MKREASANGEIPTLLRCLPGNFTCKPFRFSMGFSRDVAGSSERRRQSSLSLRIEFGRPVK